ncbi:hypothetical protein LENED_006669 [Lentinula edodes]|uniref:Uncharacterized protein n=1 Tax=Lentinula edodes TaxID=5353 RepID=A0A1Q3ECJ5_LENED|nr:hypothetical protein LENED_006669 [Lentinula edodes]
MDLRTSCTVAATAPYGCNCGNTRWEYKWGIYSVLQPCLTVYIYPEFLEISYSASQTSVLQLQLALAFTAVSLSAAAALSQSSLESESTTSAPLLVLVTATSIAVSTAVQTSFTIVPGSSITSTDLVTATSHQSEASSLAEALLPPRNFTPAPHVVTRDAGASQPAREKSSKAILGYMYTDYEPRAREFNLHGFTTFPITEGSKFETGADFPLRGGAYLEPVPWKKEVPGVWECVVSTEKQVILTAERVYIPTGFFARVGEFLKLRKIPSGVYLLFGRYSKSRFKPHNDGSPFFMKILNRYLLQSPNYPELPHAKENPLKLRVVCAEMGTVHARLPEAKWHTWKIDSWPPGMVVNF